MAQRTRPANASAIGTEVVTTKHGSNVVFKYYLVDRPAPAKNLRAAEAVLEVSFTLAHPVRQVWPLFVNFDAWMNRFGYVWEGLPAEHEDRFVYLGNTGAANDLAYATGDAKTQYVVRKVIPEQLIYFDGLPMPLVGKDGMFSGHNVVSLREEHGRTTISFFMEHTWYSETMTLAELRAEARGVTVDAGVAFWRDYFIPDLLALLEGES